MSKIIIAGKEIDVPAEYAVLQACEVAGAEIPRFCFHERLSIAGNCRMCLVEVKGGPPKPTASCAMAVKDLRPGSNGEPPVVFTNSPMARKGRKGIMEFLLINHPLDCPICDQGGECDLQDQAMAYGADSSRFAENKRAVEDKYIGALVKTSMNRCIQCTRCVRFVTEVAGVPELGAIGRGEDMEITSYLQEALSSELQGNVGDLATVEEMFALKSLVGKLGSSNIDCRQDGSKLHPKLGRASYIFNSTIVGIDQADAILIVGSSPRYEAPVLNARIRKRWLRGGAPIGVIGPKADLSYKYSHLGGGPETLAQASDRLPKDAAKPMMIVGPGAFARPDGVALRAELAKTALAAGVVKEGWNGFNVLHAAASRVGGLDLGLVPGPDGLDALAMTKANALDVLINLGADEIDIEPGAFVVYVGTHGDRGAHRADVILPGAAYTEKTGIYVNTEGMPQFAERAVFPPRDAREAWSILRALSDALTCKLPFG